MSLIGSWDQHKKGIQCAPCFRLLSVAGYQKSERTGRGEELPFVCILSQNIFNEKMYVVIWFFMVFLAIVSVMQLSLRILTIFFPSIQRAYVIWETGTVRGLSKRSKSAILHSTIDKIIANIDHVGDWFVLCQLGSNVTNYFYRDFLFTLRSVLIKDGNADEGSLLIDIKSGQENHESNE